MGKTTAIVKGVERKSIVPVSEREGDLAVRGKRASAPTIYCGNMGPNELAAAAKAFAGRAKKLTERREEKIGEMFKAANKGKWDEVMDIVDENNINAGNAHGMTLLMIAAAQGKGSIVQKLIDIGADKNQIDRYDRSAVTHALLDKENHAAKLLKALGADWKKDLYVAVRDRRVLLVNAMKEVLKATDEDVAWAEAECDPERGPALTHRVLGLGGETNAQQALTVAFQPERVRTGGSYDPKIVEPGSASTAPKKPHISFQGC